MPPHTAEGDTLRTAFKEATDARLQLVKQQGHLRKSLSLVALLLSVVAFALNLAVSEQNSTLRHSAPPAAIAGEVVRLRNELSQVRSELQVLKDRPVSPSPGVNLSILERRVAIIAKRQEELDAILTTSPDKALAVPLLRKDLDAQKENVAQSVASLRASLDQLYDLTKWLLGALAVSVASLAISTYLPKPRATGDGDGR